jgi:hypothetical protein
MGCSNGWNVFDINNGAIAASGNIMFLMDKTGKLRSLEGYNYCFQCLFDGCESLTKAPELPATILSKGCYVNMFMLCSSLMQAPELPAITLT